METLLTHKAAGNDAYKAKEYEKAIKAYTLAVAPLPLLDDDSDDDAPPPPKLDPELLKQGAIVLCNRAAAYMAINKPTAAVADAQRAADFDKTNWKTHWRWGLSLMMQVPSIQRSQQAIAAFERTLECPTLPESERTNAKEALNRAKYRLEQGRDALDMPDMSNCCIS